ncbi:MAG: hypothetical protein ACLGIO_07930 [Acidimicrobiia bacterium]
MSPPSANTASPSPTSAAAPSLSRDDELASGRSSTPRRGDRAYTQASSSAVAGRTAAPRLDDSAPPTAAAWRRRTSISAAAGRPDGRPKLPVTAARAEPHTARAAVAPVAGRHAAMKWARRYISTSPRLSSASVAASTHAGELSRSTPATIRSTTSPGSTRSHRLSSSDSPGKASSALRVRACRSSLARVSSHA